MRGYTYISLLAVAVAVTARSAQHVGKTLPELPQRRSLKYGSEGRHYPQVNKRQASANASSNELSFIWTIWPRD